MPAGLQLWDANQALILDTSYDVARILGTRYVNTASGSLYDERLSSGRPFFSYQMTFDNDSTALSYGGNFSAYFSGNSLIWALNGEYSIGTIAVFLSYGVY